jgi:hypothetical protein
MIPALFAVLFFALQLTGTDSYPDREPPAMVQADSDSVAASIIMGTEDYFWQTGWDYSSIERMSVMLNSGPYGFYGPQPAFMLNEIPFDPTFFGITYSQLFPVSFFRVERRNVHQGAGVQDGVVYHSGMMRIKSDPIERGISLFGAGQLGHNSGEPGPWVFDPQSVSPNVERFGPWVDGGLALKFGNWYAKGVLRYHSYVNIDEFIQTRLINIRGFPEENLWLDLEATTTLGLVETGYEGVYATIRMQAIQSESDEFLFFQPFAREIPTGLSTEQYSALANIHFSENTGIRNLFQWREKSTQYRTNRFDYDFGWERNEQIYRSSFYHHGEMFSLDGGTEIEQSFTKARGMEDEELTMLSFFLKPEIHFTDDLRVGATGVMQFFDEQSPVFQVAAYLDADLAPGWHARFEVNQDELYQQSSNPVDSWVNRGYNLYHHLGINSFLPPEIENNRLRSFSNRHFLRISDSVSLTKPPCTESTGVW